MIFNESKICDFLNIHYNNIDFYINREQFCGSSTFAIIGSAQIDFKYFSDITIYGEEKLLLFDLNSYLIKKFNAKLNGTAKLTIIVDTNNFSQNNKKTVEKNLLFDGREYSTRYIGCLIPSSSEITKSPLQQFHIFSDIFLQTLLRYGIIACFFAGKKIMYLIDLEKFIVSALL